MSAITLYLGLDVHKDSITIAIAEPGPKGENRLFGTISNDLHAIEKALNRIRKAHPGASLEVAYEAGPCGFVIARRLKQLNPRVREFDIDSWSGHFAAAFPGEFPMAFRDALKDVVTRSDLYREGPGRGLLLGA